MAASAQTRVLLADDEPLVRAGLAMLIASDRDLLVVGQANDGIEALRRAATLAPDVVVMDVRMPRLDGVEATRRLIGDHGCFKIIGLGSGSGMGGASAVRPSGWLR